MFDIKIAGIRMRIMNRHEEIRRRCEDYIVTDDGAPDMVFTATDRELEFICDDISVDEPEAEVHCIPKYLYPLLPQYDAFWLHGCVVEMDGGSYIFTAESGYGKTTHARLWLKAFGEKARIINGDNPLIRLEGGRFVAYGTPFAGKEGYNVNTSALIKGLCYLTRSEKNGIRRMHPEIAFAQILRDCQSRMNAENGEHMMELIEQFAQSVPVYQLYCNQDMEAAYVAYEGMKNG